MKQPFDFDSRNIGGREQLAGRMFSHHKALVNIKPTINMNNPPHPHVNANKKSTNPPQYKMYQEYNNVYKTFKKIAETKKGYIDSNAPDTLKINLKAKNKQELFLQMEHQKRMEAQIKRINAIGSMKERMKNQNDPIAHPAILFRRPQEKKDVNQDYIINQVCQPKRTIQTANLTGLQKKLQKNQEGGGETIEKSYQKEGGTHVDYDKEIEKLKNQPLKPVVDKRPQSAKVNKKLVDDQNQEVTDFIHEIPKVQGQSDKDYEEIKIKLVQLIVKYRIYKKVDLESLFGRTIIHNQHLDMDLLEEIFTEIREELDK